MRKILAVVVLSGLFLTSCSKTYKNETVKYTTSVKYFEDQDIEENGIKNYAKVSIDSLILDWDGKESRFFREKEDVFEVSKGKQLLKVFLHTSAVPSSLDFTVNEANIEIFNNKTKVSHTYELDIEMSGKDTFSRTGGYVVFAVDENATLDDLYLAYNEANTSLGAKDWSKEDIKSLIPLKEETTYDASEKEIVINKSYNFSNETFPFECTLKTVVLNINDDILKAYSEKEFNILKKNDKVIKLTFSIKNLTGRDISSFSKPKLSSKYETFFNMNSSLDLEEIGMVKKDQEKLVHLYYKMHKGIKLESVIWGNSIVYSFE